MASRAGSVFGRVLLVLLGLLLLATAFLFTRMPRASADRIEAALDAVGVSAGGSLAWIIRTPNGAALVDAGIDPDAQAILRELRAQGLTADQVHTILLTHGHEDHWAGASKFPNAKVYVGPGDAALIRGERESKAPAAPVFAWLSPGAPPPANLVELKDEAELTVDGQVFQVVYVPGHTPGSVMYLRHGLLFTGDALHGTGRGVAPSPSATSEDDAQNLASLSKLKDLPFTRIADGHVGVTADARQKLRRMLE